MLIYFLFAIALVYDIKPHMYSIRASLAAFHFYFCIH